MVLTAIDPKSACKGFVQEKLVDPCVLVIFGATGDLTARKLMPAIYNLTHENQLSSHFACVGFARRDKGHGIFRQEMKEAVEKYSRTGFNEELWESFSKQLFYHRSSFDDDEGYRALGELLRKIDSDLGTRANRVFYLATQPTSFPVIIEHLSRHKLIYGEGSDKAWSRVIIEKPFGRDAHSAGELQKEISRYLREEQIYRIDHYLGKETVQNLLIFRFANSIFEALWNHNYIDHVQITVAESIGIGTRGRLWEKSGILRDIVQNHMMQLLSLVAMEPPSSLTANAIRDEKVKVVQSIRPILMEEALRAQYTKGLVAGEEVRGYREEDDVAKDSFIETYAALKLYIDNWRWAGVPFFLRAGKRMPKRTTEIAVVFKDPPRTLYKKMQPDLEGNTLAIRIQPDEGFSIRLNSKVPGNELLIEPLRMNCCYASYFGKAQQEAYERLLCDCMSGDSTLFARDDEVEASWKLLTPVLKQWQEQGEEGVEFYPAGSWGPKAANRLMVGGKKWRLL